MDSDKADVQREKFLVAWEQQEGKKSIVAALKAVYGWRFAMAGAIKLGHDLLQYVAPIWLSLIVGFIENGSKETIAIFDGSAGFVYAFLLFVCQVVELFPERVFFTSAIGAACKLVPASSTIYEKKFARKHVRAAWDINWGNC